MNETIDKSIEELAKLAVGDSAEFAMKYSQAVLNLANAKRALADSVFDPHDAQK